MKKHIKNPDSPPSAPTTSKNGAPPDRKSGNTARQPAPQQPPGQPKCGASTEKRSEGGIHTAVPGTTFERTGARRATPGEIAAHKSPSRKHTKPQEKSPGGRTAGSARANNTYTTYRLIGALAAVAAVLVAIIVMLFAGGAPAGIPSIAGMEGETDLPDDTPSGKTAPAEEEDSGKLILKNKDRIFVVCIDPGHGYDDPGAICEETMGDVTEKEVALAVGLMLRDKLEEAGIKVIMTRSDDTVPPEHDGSQQYTLDPFERVDFVKSHPETSLFISLHCDAFTDDTSVGGTRIYIYEGGVEGTQQYAQALADAIGQQISSEVPVIAKDIYEAYYVTKKLTVPSVLIEMGFITNDSDAKNLLSDEWRKAFVYGTAAGIIAYINSLGFSPEV
ncbi:MAG: N-acetylmuramoyl-L-alanine amidase [Clostridiales bacterium]|nr:N-acetylmuramoyl-L-alanine amidase [Clostridiales bacterium]